MGKCACCGKFILGGKKQGDLRFCNDACHAKGFLVPLVESAAPEDIAQRLQEVQQQSCPKCGGAGPLDIYTAHTAWSAVVLTSWKDSPRLLCPKCGPASIRRGIAFTAMCGWWGFPFGLFVTPWQLMNGVKSLSISRDRSEPSAELQELVKLGIAAEFQSERAGK